jgi:hypothetical protein
MVFCPEQCRELDRHRIDSLTLRAIREYADQPIQGLSSSRSGNFAAKLKASPTLWVLKLCLCQALAIFNLRLRLCGKAKTEDPLIEVRALLIDRLPSQ